MPISWTTVGALIALVSPLYASTFMIYYRLGEFKDTPSDVTENEENIRDLRDDVREIKHMVDQLREDHGVIHESQINPPDHNPCEHPECEWCGEGPIQDPERSEA